MNLTSIIFFYYFHKHIAVCWNASGNGNVNLDYAPSYCLYKKPHL